MKKTDLDHSGFVSLTQFTAACLDQEILLKPEFLQYFFETFDIDQDGCISISDIRKFWGEKQPV